MDRDRLIALVCDVALDQGGDWDAVGRVLDERLDDDDLEQAEWIAAWVLGNYEEPGLGPEVVRALRRCRRRRRRPQQRPQPGDLPHGVPQVGERHRKVGAAVGDLADQPGDVPAGAVGPGLGPVPLAGEPPRRDLGQPVLGAHQGNDIADSPKLSA